MLTHAQARTMAEAVWGNGGTRSERTNRSGAFYFSCSGHGGFILDGRCLSEDEKTALKQYQSPEVTAEYYDPATKKSRRFLNPYRTTSRSFKVMPTWQKREVEIFLFEEDCAWCLPVIFAGIRTKAMTDEDALKSFSMWYAKSNHGLLKAQASVEARKKTT